MKIHPDLHKWPIAKAAAFALASAAGIFLGQSPQGKPRAIQGSRTQDFPSWLAAWTWLYRIRLDQIQKKG